MGPLLENVLLRGFLWVGLPILLIALAIGPGRFWGAVKRGWNWLWRKRLDPEEVLSQVVKQYQDLVASLNKTLTRSREAEAEIERHISRSEENLRTLEAELHRAAANHDDLEGKALLYKINLERQALETFRQQRERQIKQIDDLRKHLYLAELQLRQYEVGRTILLSQLAEAQTVEQQFTIASQFDPFSAVANWKQAENIVEEKQLNARAVERVYSDLLEVPLTTERPASPAPPDPAALDEEYRRVKEHVREKR